jgi:L-rhamnose mutarotase
MQRFCLTLEMPYDPVRNDEYVARHRAVWPQVLESIRDAGVVGMDIYRDGTRLVMIMETDDDFTMERKAAMDRSNPIVMQWEAEMAKYQGSDPTADASSKWLPMEKIFNLQSSLHARSE